VALSVVLLATGLAACGSTNYNTELGALASAVQGAEHGHLVHVKCVGEIPYQRQKELKARLHRNTYYRYRCTGETSGHPGSVSVTRIIRVSPNGKVWYADKKEEQEEASEQRESEATKTGG
jgi:hypothetical protein